MQTDKKIIINFCPTGMVPQKKDTPHVPISPSEIIEQTHQAYEKGITIVHLHAREEDGTPSWRPEIYREIFEGVRRHCSGLVICGSTSGRLFQEFEKRSAVIELKPDMCSLTLSSLNFSGQASINAPEMIIKLCDKMNEFGVHHELECFDLGMINFGKYLIKRGYISSPAYWNLLFGNISGMQASCLQMGLAVQEIPADHFVALAGIGMYQQQVSTVAVAMGHGVRIGLEDNIWFDSNRTKKATNLELLERVHQLIEINQKKVMSSTEFGNSGFYNGKK